MVTITKIVGGTFSSDEIEAVVAQAHTIGTIKSVRANERWELIRFFEILDVVDAVFRKTTGIIDLDDPSY